MDYSSPGSRWLRSSPSHDRDPALGEARGRRGQSQSHSQSQSDEDASTSTSTSTSTSNAPSRTTKSSLFDVPPGSRTIVSGGRQNGRQTPLTQSHSSHLGSSTNSTGSGMMVDEIEGQHRGRLTRLQRKSMLKSDEASMLANEISPDQRDNDGQKQEQEQDRQSSMSMDYTFARPAPPTSAPASTSYFQQQQSQIDTTDPYPSLSSQPQASTSYALYQQPPSHGRSLSSIDTSFDASTSRAPRSANPFAGQQYAQQQLHQQSQQQPRYANTHHSRSSSVSSVQGGPLSSGFIPPTQMFRPHSQSISSSTSSSFGDSASIANSLINSSRDGTSTPSSSTIRRVNRLTNLDRKELCEYAALHPRMKHDLLGQLFNVERSTVSKILKNRTKWLAVKSDNTLSPPSSSSSTFPANQITSPRRNTYSSSSSSSSLAAGGTDRPTPLTPSTSTSTSTPAATSTATSTRPKIGGRHPELEVLLGEWGRSETRQGNLLSDELVREQALKIAASLNIPLSSFKASVGWLDNFKERMGYKSGEFDLDPKYEKLPDNHPELKNKRNEEHRKAVRDRKTEQSNPSVSGNTNMTISVGMTVGGGGGDEMDENESVSPCWTPSEASYRSTGSGWLSPVSISGGGGSHPMRMNTRESLSLSSSAASLPGLVEEDDDDFSEEDLIRSHHARNMNNSSGSSGLRSSSRGSSLALHSITGLHSNSSSTNPSPTSYTHPQLYGSDSTAGAGMQHMTTPRQQRHHPYQQQRHAPEYSHTPLSPHHSSFPQHLQFGNNKSMQQASIAFNLNLNSTPLQTIEARTPLELHSPTLPPEMRGTSTSPAPAGLTYAHPPSLSSSASSSYNAGQDNDAGLASSSGRSVYSLRTRMASAPQTQTQSQQQLGQSVSARTRQATYPQHSSSLPSGIQEQSSYMIPGFPTQANPPAKIPLQRAHTAPMIPQLDEHHFDFAMGAVSPQSQPEIYLSSDQYHPQQQQYMIQDQPPPPSSASSAGLSNADYISQPMMQMDSEMTAIMSENTHNSPQIQSFDNTGSQQSQQQQQMLEREQAILAVEGQLTYHSPNAYSPTSFGGGISLPSQSPHLLNPPSMAPSTHIHAGGSYGASLSPSTATPHWSEKITFDEAYMALRKVVGYLHDQQGPTYQNNNNQHNQQQAVQAGIAAPSQVATLEHLLGQFRAASTSRYPHLTPPSST